ncbi:MAG: leucine-rich repeat domain-containing protein, partial [Abditibacteriota bacterium]|nr:leucine-rich repeat domain-containing protein [Abditibacteriota bacterium]
MRKTFVFVLMAAMLATIAFADIPAAEKAAVNELGALANRAPLYSVENGHVGVIDLHDANLTTLPESIGNLTGLYLLNLSFNKITALPASFGNLKNLKWLYLNNNGLTSLPESFGNLTALRTLELNDNNLTALPA